MELDDLSLLRVSPDNLPEHLISEEPAVREVLNNLAGPSPELGLNHRQLRASPDIPPEHLDVYMMGRPHSG